MRALLSSLGAAAFFPLLLGVGVMWHWAAAAKDVVPDEVAAKVRGGACGYRIELDSYCGGGGGTGCNTTVSSYSHYEQIRHGSYWESHSCGGSCCYNDPYDCSYECHEG
jgi:hypothetical protein